VKKVLLGTLTVLLVVFYLILPKPLFKDPRSTILNDANGKLIAAKIATDGQWRFPQNDSVPAKFKTAIRYFEDEYFYYHPGINPVSMLKALMGNLKAGSKRRGGSTITSQTIRLARKGKSRSYCEKLVETILAIRIELSLSKEEILSLYASNAPFGGNVVGLDAASWRYYGRGANLLSWGEMATLAVLPNAPSLIYPGKNHSILLAKRNKLLDKLLIKGEIDSITCELAKLEPLPSKPKPLPRITPHLLERAILEGNGGEIIHSTINSELQKEAAQIVNRHYNSLKQNRINNAALMIVEVATGNVLAYVGNTNSTKDDGNEVDIITAERSSGSILKPLLYAYMQQEGLLLPNTLLADVPTQIAGYSPSNFNKLYDGAVPANKALARSLNIPAVRMLRTYGVDKFCDNLKQLGFSSIRNSGSNYYGLSLILGGAEVRLWDLARVYGSMAHNLQYQNETGVAPKFSYSLGYDNDRKTNKKPNLSSIDVGATYLTFNALTEMDRPIEGTEWSNYASSQKIAWKTGTSFGHRDAWAVGVTSKYVVVTWVGNADGEGRPGLTGASSAAPIMFKAFKLLPKSAWFDAPENNLSRQVVCTESGYKASPICENTHIIYASINADRTTICPYHQLIHLDKTEQYQVNSTCYPVEEIKTKSWFLLPHVMEWYYKRRNPNYTTLPLFKEECISERPLIELIYPQQNQQIFIPKSFNNQFEKVVCKATHRQPTSIIYWHLDEYFLGQTSNGIHQMEIMTLPGKHTLTLIDEKGNSIERKIEVIGK